SNHLNQIMMYQNLFPQQLAARFRCLAENAMQEKKGRPQNPDLFPSASVSSSIRSNIKSEDGHEDSCIGSLHASKRIISEQYMSSERRTSDDKSDIQNQEFQSSRKRARSSEQSEHEINIKRAKHSDEDNEEIIVDDGNTDSSSEHESVSAPTITQSETNHESPDHEADTDIKKDQDLTVYVNGERTVIYSCHICDCFFLKESAHSIHMGAHMGSMMNLHSSIQLGHRQLSGKLTAGMH
ncbi:unnamed protein product, partial [Oikopleura dioica]